jgi:hypothetical protein
MPPFTINLIAFFLDYEMPFESQAFSWLYNILNMLHELSRAVLANHIWLLSIWNMGVWIEMWASIKYKPNFRDLAQKRLSNLTNSLYDK